MSLRGVKERDLPGERVTSRRYEEKRGRAYIKKLKKKRKKRKSCCIQWLLPSVLAGLCSFVLYEQPQMR